MFPRSRLRLCLPVLLIAFLALSSAAIAQQKAAPSPARLKIRTITAFINLDRAQYKEQVADTLQMLRRAKVTFESRGYEVQTTRTPPHPFPKQKRGPPPPQTVPSYKDYAPPAKKKKSPAEIGPAMLNAGDPESQADLLAEILSNTKHIRASIVIAAEDG